MIRFIPDSLLEALLRFFAMAASNGNVYVEIPAPDIRFAIILVLALVVALCWRHLRANPRPALALLALVIVSAAPWMLTSGNGRYWMPMLLAAGPLAVALIYLLPVTKAFRLFLASGLLALQVFVLLQTSPWGAWAWVAWDQAPYFKMELPKAESTPAPTTYISLSTISYSLIAPQFPPESRWMNITSIGGTVRDAAWAKDFLDKSPGALKMVAPSIQGQIASDGGPTPEVRKALDLLLGSQSMALVPGVHCDLLHSSSLAVAAGTRGVPSDDRRDAGFWICPLRYPVKRPPENLERVDPKTEAVFVRIETMCPRFFAPGGKTLRIQSGALRHYPGADMKIYVMDDGEVLYKFWRALNAVTVGRVDEILSGRARVDCDHIRGRSGLPWDREI